MPLKISNLVFNSSGRDTDDNGYIIFKASALVENATASDVKNCYAQFTIDYPYHPTSVVVSSAKNTFNSGGSSTRSITTKLYVGDATSANFTVKAIAKGDGVSDSASTTTAAKLSWAARNQPPKIEGVTFSEVYRHHSDEDRISFKVNLEVSNYYNYAASEVSATIVMNFLGYKKTVYTNTVSLSPWVKTYTFDPLPVTNYYVGDSWGSTPVSVTVDLKSSNGNRDSVSVDDVTIWIPKKLDKFYWKSDKTNLTSSDIIETCITAERWGKLQAAINERRESKKLSRYSFTTVKAGDSISAWLYNQMADAINAMKSGAITKVSSGDFITASCMNVLQNTVNDIT